MLPSSYTCHALCDFIGPAKACAAFLSTKLVPALQHGRDPYRIVFTGPPGVGKSQLAAFLAAALGAGKWNVTKMNGGNVDTDMIDHLTQQFRYKDLQQQ